jgi:hypothetical protein
MDNNLELPNNLEYAEYAPVEGHAGFWRIVFGATNTAVAATGAKINGYTPTPAEIAERKYVLRRYQPIPRWLRWFVGD